MQTLSGPTLQLKHRGVFLLLLFFLLASCSREEMQIVNLQSKVQQMVYPVQGHSTQLLTLSFAVTGKPTQKQVHIVSSNKVSSWVLSSTADAQNMHTIGPLSMGEDVMLPQGLYRLSVLSEDGQTLEETFEVKYASPSGLVVYDGTDHTILLTEGSARLSLYGQDGVLIGSSNLEVGTPFKLDEQTARAEVELLGHEVKYIINP